MGLEKLNPEPALVVYDLRVLPATFDLLGFIAVAWAQLRIKFSGMDLVIVAPDDGWTNRDFDFANVRPLDEVRERIFRLFLPAAQLFPFVVSVSVLSTTLARRFLYESSRDVAFPNSYNFEEPAMFAYYKGHMLLAAAKTTDVRYVTVPKKALSLAQSLLNLYGLTERNFVALALRHNAVSRDRTRDTPVDWVNRVVTTLSPRFKIAVLPDLGQQLVVQGMSASISVLREPQFDIQVRAAIYALAKMAIVGPTGPSSLAYLNKDCSYCYVGLAASDYFDASWHRNQGWIENVNMFSTGNPSQRWYWDYPDPGEINQLLMTSFA